MPRCRIFGKNESIKTLGAPAAFADCRPLDRPITYRLKKDELPYSRCSISTSAMNWSRR